MSEVLYRAIYCSRNMVESGLEEYWRILAVSRINNARDGLTGALLFSNGSFAQVLEGPLAALERSFERIQRDPRHAGITVLQFERVETRAFPDWSMAEVATMPVPTGPAAEVLNMLRQLVGREAEWAMAG